MLIPPFLLYKINLELDMLISYDVTFCKILCTHMKQSKVFYPFPIFFCSFQICFAKSIFECSKDLFANVLKWESGQGKNVLWLNPPMHKFYWHFILYMIWWLSYFTHHLLCVKSTNDSRLGSVIVNAIAFKMKVHGIETML